MKSNTILHSLLTLAISVTAIGILAVSVWPQESHANEAYGWYRMYYDYLGPSTGCAANEFRLSVVLLDYTTRLPIGDQPNLSVRYRYSDGTPTGYLFSPAFPYTAATLQSVCIHHDRFFGIEVSAGPGATYESLNSGAWISDLATSRDNLQGKHFRTAAYLKRVGDPATRTTLSPSNQILNVSPAFRWSLNEIMPIFGANLTSFTIVDTYNALEQRIDRRTNAVGYTPGIIAFPALSLSDGFYSWTVSHNANGSHATPGISFPSIRQPISGPAVDRPQFLLDRTAPLVTVDHTISNVTAGAFDAEIRIDAIDNLAGLASALITIYSDVGGVTTEVGNTTINFPVGSGVVGGPTSLQSVAVPLTLPTLGMGTYRYTVLVTDVAGNTRSVDLVELYPALSTDLEPLLNPFSLPVNTPISSQPFEVVNNGTGDVASFDYTIRYAGSLVGSGTEGLVAAGATRLVSGAISYTTPAAPGVIAVEVCVQDASMATPACDTTSLLVTDIAPPSLAVSLTASQNLIRANTPATLSYTIISPAEATCTLSGSSLSPLTFSYLPATSGVATEVTTGPIENSSRYTLTCTSISGTPIMSDTTTVNVIPTFQEG